MAEKYKFEILSSDEIKQNCTTPPMMDTTKKNQTIQINKKYKQKKPTQCKIAISKVQ